MSNSAAMPLAATWFAALSDYTESLPPVVPASTPKRLEDSTIRQLIQVSGGGSQVRLTVSNLMGDAPVRLSRLAIARVAGDAAAIDASSSRALTFGGAEGVSLAPGSAACSDSVEFDLAADSLVAISIHVAAAASLRTVHRLACQRAYVAPGDVTGQAAPAWSELIDERRSIHPGGFNAWITELAVPAPAGARVIVAFGDSTTDGFGSTPDRHLRWPSQLSRMLHAEPSTARPSFVVNAGLSGNRWLTDVNGPHGLGRFERDVLSVAGATHVVMCMGINDIGYDNFAPLQLKSVADVAGAVQTAVQRARARGLVVLVGTLPPMRRTAYFYSDERDAKRMALNRFIRHELQGADAIVDFDRLLQSPTDAQRLRKEYDCGDHLHPSDAGYAAMAAGVAAALRSLG